MLRLLSESDPTWIEVALSDLDALLVDHAHCEHKAAVTALSFVSRYCDDPELVEKLSALAAEEAEHLNRVSTICHARGLKLGTPQEDPYVKALLKACHSDPARRRVDRLLTCAIIEARSCERLKLLAENLDDADLRAFYDELWRVEAGHHQLFIDLAARTMDEEDVQERLRELCAHEAEVLARLPVLPRIH